MAVSDQIAALQLTVNTLNNNVSQLVAQANGKIDSLNQITTAVTLIKTAIDQTKTAIDQSAAAVAATQSQVTPLAAQVATAKDQVTGTAATVQQQATDVASKWADANSAAASASASLTAVNTVTKNAFVEVLWSALAARTGASDGVGGMVTGDSGTHTDPVTGLTVPNSGQFQWVAASTAWRWLYADPLAQKADSSTVTTLVATTDRSAAIAGQNDSDRFDYFVDSVLGDDTFDGKTKLKAFKTLAPLTALTLPTGTRIGLARGSVFYSRFASAAANLLVSAYGTGADPIGDCSDPCPAFTLTSGETVVYQTTLTLPGDSKVMGNIFTGTTALKQVTSLALCRSTPGSCYVVSWSSTSTVAYVHTATDVAPGADGLQYRYTSRLNFLDLTGANPTVRGVQGQWNAHQDGSIRIASEYALVQYVVTLKGARHQMYIGANSLLEDCTFTDSFNDLEGSGDGPVANSGTVVGKRYTTRRCKWYAVTSTQFTMGATHGAAGELYTQVLHEYPEFYGPMAGLGSSGAIDYRVRQPKYSNVSAGWGVSGGTLTCEGGTGSISSYANFTGASTMVSQGANLTIPVLTNGFIRGGNASYQSVFTFVNDSYYVKDGKGAGVVAQFVVNPRITLNGNFSLGPAIAAPVDLMFASAALTDNLDACSYPYGTRMTVNGTTYPTLAAYQAATGKQPNSIIKALPFIAHTRDFTQMADGYLDGVSGITSIGPNTNKGKVLSGSFQSELINSSGRQLYAFGKATDNNMWARCVVAGAPASYTSYLAICATDQDNWIGVRFSTTNVQVIKCVAGVSTQLAGAAATMAVGDEIVIARRDGKLFYYRNGVNQNNATWATGISDAILASGLRFGIVATGNIASGPLFSSVQFGRCD